MERAVHVSAGPPRFKEVKELARSAELIASPYDTDARYSTKRDISWVGYRVHLTETCDEDSPNLITDVLTTEATSPDENKLPVIQEALQERNLLPAEQLIDAGTPTPVFWRPVNSSMASP